VVSAFGVTQPVAAADGGLVVLGGAAGAGYRQAWAWDGTAWRRR